MSSAAAKKTRREDDKLGEDIEGEVTNFLTQRELGRVRTTERRARHRKYSAAITKITVPRDSEIQLNFWQRYNLETVTEIDGELSNMTDADLEYVVAPDCPNLTSLNLQNCGGLTDAAVIALSQGCPRLSFLDLTFCQELTDESVIALAQGCPELATLSLYACYHVTYAAVIALAECQKLEKLDLQHTDFGNYDDWELPMHNAQSFFETKVRRRGGSSGASGAARQLASQLTTRSAPARRMRLSYRAWF